MHKSDEQIIAGMIGKTYVSVTGDRGDDAMEFRDAQGNGVRFYHSQDCCESVDIDDITGDLSDLLNSAIIKADVRTSDKNPEGVIKEYQDSFHPPSHPCTFGD